LDWAGSTKTEDAVEYLLAGAAAVQVGTANFYNPKAPLDILQRSGQIFTVQEIEIGKRSGREDEAMNRKVIVALDVSSREEALQLLEQLRDLAGMFKVGGQLFMSAGPGIIQEIIGKGGNVFLDLSFTIFRIP